MTEGAGYFSLDEDLERAGTGRYVERQDIDPIQFVPGLAFAPVLGDRAMVNWVSFDPHTEAPQHAHEEEQFTIVVEGEMEFELDGDVRVMRPGSIAVIPPGVPHGARTGEASCLEIDVFVPPRKALLDLMNAEQPSSDRAPGTG